MLAVPPQRRESTSAETLSGAPASKQRFQPLQGFALAVPRTANPKMEPHDLSHPPHSGFRPLSPLYRFFPLSSTTAFARTRSAVIAKRIFVRWFLPILKMFPSTKVVSTQRFYRPDRKTLLGYITISERTIRNCTLMLKSFPCNRSVPDGETAQKWESSPTVKCLRLFDGQNF